MKPALITRVYYYRFELVNLHDSSVVMSSVSPAFAALGDEEAMAQFRRRLNDINLAARNSATGLEGDPERPLFSPPISAPDGP